MFVHEPIRPSSRISLAVPVVNEWLPGETSPSGTMHTPTQVYAAIPFRFRIVTRRTFPVVPCGVPLIVTPPGVTLTRLLPVVTSTVSIVASVASALSCVAPDGGP